VGRIQQNKEKPREKEEKGKTGRRRKVILSNFPQMYLDS
jgi:hypothetical protein